MSVRQWVVLHRWRVLALAVGGVVAIVAASWILAARAESHHVEASWTLHCPTGTLRTSHGDPVIRSRSGWKCEVALTITNSGGRSIRVSHVFVPLLGSGAGAEVRGYSTKGARLHDVGGSSADVVNGVYDVDVEVPGHTSRTIALVIGWRAQGCNGAGSIGSPHWPRIEFRVGGLSFDRSARQRLLLQTYDDPHDQIACPA